jgi:DNA-binding NtrC family response regulator
MPQNVLLVDDEPAVLDSLRRSLRREPFTVSVACDASAAMDVMQDVDIDVVVTDDGMPGVSGVEFVSQIRTLHPRAVRIMLTGQATVPRMIQAVNDGAVFRFLTKPCPQEELVQAVHQALDHRLLLDSGRSAVALMRRYGMVLRWIGERHPELLRRAVEGQVDVRLRPDDFQTADVLVEQMHLQIDDGNRALEPRIPGSAAT